MCFTNHCFVSVLYNVAHMFYLCVCIDIEWLSCCTHVSFVCMYVCVDIGWLVNCLVRKVVHHGWLRERDGWG